MKTLLPQEIQANYVLPALRRELALSLIDQQKLKQSDAAALLGVTSSAISQYRSAKRGGRLKFGDEMLEEIRISSQRLKNGTSEPLQELLRLLNLPRAFDIVCNIHKKDDPEAENACAECHIAPENRPQGENND